MEQQKEKVNGATEREREREEKNERRKNNKWNERDLGPYFMSMPMSLCVRVC